MRHIRIWRGCAYALSAAAGLYIVGCAPYPYYYCVGPPIDCDPGYITICDPPAAPIVNVNRSNPIVVRRGSYCETPCDTGCPPSVIVGTPAPWQPESPPMNNAIRPGPNRVPLTDEPILDQTEDPIDSLPTLVNPPPSARSSTPKANSNKNASDKGNSGRQFASQRSNAPSDRGERTPESPSRSEHLAQGRWRAASDSEIITEFDDSDAKPASDANR